MSIAMAGGIPEKLLAKDLGGFARTLGGIMHDLTPWPVLHLEWALDSARRRAEALPDAFQTEDVRAMMAEIAMALEKLRRELAPNEAAPLAALDRLRPSWREDLPEGLSDETIHRLLSARPGAAQAAPRESSVVERRLALQDGLWKGVAVFPAKALIAASALGFPVERGRFVAEGALRRVAPGLLLAGFEENKALALERLSGPERAPFPLDEALELAWAQDGARKAVWRPPQGRAVGRLSFWRLCGGDEAAPIELRHVGAGPVQTRDAAIFVRAEGEAPTCEGLSGAPIGEDLSGARVWRLTGSGVLIHEGERVRVRTASDKEAAPTLLADGATLRGAQTPDGERVYLGWPRFFTQDGPLRREIPSKDMRWRAPGGAGWRALTDEPPLGEIRAARFEKGEAVESLRLATAPPGLALEIRALRAGAARVTLKGAPLGTRMTLSVQGGSSLEAAQGEGGVLMGEAVAQGRPPRQIRAMVQAPSLGARLEALLPFAQNDGGFYAPDGLLAPREFFLSASDLYGWRVGLPCAGNGGTMAGSLGLQALREKAEAPLIWSVDVEDGSPLAAFEEEILNGLACFGADAEVRLRVASHGGESGVLIVRRYVGQVPRPERDVLLLGQDAFAQMKAKGAALEALNLRAPEWRESLPLQNPVEIPVELLRDVGPWLIMAPKGGPALRPALWKGVGDGTEGRSCLSAGFQAASSSDRRDERIEAFARALRDLTMRPEDEDWRLLEVLLEAAPDPAALDQVQALAHAPEAAALLLWRASPGKLEERLGLGRRTDLFWPASPIRCWALAARRLHDERLAQMSRALGDAEQARRYVLESLKDTGGQIAMSRPDLSAHVEAAFLAVGLREAPSCAPKAADFFLGRLADAAVRRDPDRSRLPRSESLPAVPEAQELLDRYDSSLRPLLAAPFAAAAMALERAPFRSPPLRQARLIDPGYFNEALPFAICKLQGAAS